MLHDGAPHRPSLLGAEPGYGWGTGVRLRPRPPPAPPVCRMWARLCVRFAGRWVARAITRTSTGRASGRGRDSSGWAGDIAVPDGRPPAKRRRVRGTSPRPPIRRRGARGGDAPGRSWFGPFHDGQERQGRGVVLPPREHGRCPLGSGQLLPAAGTGVMRDREHTAALPQQLLPHAPQKMLGIAGATAWLHTRCAPDGPVALSRVTAWPSLVRLSQHCSQPQPLPQIVGVHALGPFRLDRRLPSARCGLRGHGRLSLDG